MAKILRAVSERASPARVKRISGSLPALSMMYIERTGTAKLQNPMPAVAYCATGARGPAEMKMSVE